MQRRDFVLGALGASALSYLAPTLAAMAAGGEPIPYGTCIRTDPLFGDPAYQKAVLDYCQVVGSEGNLKWGDLRPDRHTFNFEQADQLMAFAEEHGLEMRGHTLAWYGAMPDWTNEIASADEARLELTSHIRSVVGRYKGRIKSWDVVNEPLADHPKPGDLIRESVWQKYLGADYIELALRTAAETDSEAQLVINDYDIEQATDRGRARRKALLDLLRDLLDRGVPLHAVGIQGHLHGAVPIDSSGLTSFVAEVKAMGLAILVTELDVIDNELPADIAERDAAVAECARQFLAAIGAAARPERVLTWGITDQHTWVPIWFSRGDGLPNRPLPLDADFKPKPLMDVIQEFTHSFS